ncbi:hypothetical protein BJ878DRAFT_422156 [Calycina marina]|uniref:Uncharacterized protein n=1 Tax=Calycina marina TaxID=1763456 RepID=A0A9P7Z2I8_9HELO|nr:hypothetical protein BJ878DRAFT_422156 [Calycina marina]
MDSRGNDAGSWKDKAPLPGFQRPIFFASTTVFLVALFKWPIRWIISGAPILQFTILLGTSTGTRVLPRITLYPLFTTLNLIYAVASTSWLLYDVYVLICYPAIFITCLFQFESAAYLARKSLRAAIKNLHFIDDKIAFFNIPALEIDTEVDGLMVLRGITFSLSSLSFIVHGVELGIKLSNDMELAIQTQSVEVRLLRGIWINDCYANLKGGKYEMTFGEIDAKTTDTDGDQIFIKNTALLRAATKELESDWGLPLSDPNGEPRAVKMTEEMTGGSGVKPSSPGSALHEMKQLSPDNGTASERYYEMIEHITNTCAIHEASKHVKENADAELCGDPNDLRAAIASQLHAQPSVPHPPSRSIKVTTLQQLSPSYVRHLLHRLPMLLRLLLNPLSYFHPVHINSITASASGRWIESILVDYLFGDYDQTNSQIKSLKTRISDWLSDANFAVQLVGILGLAQVPFLTNYKILAELSSSDITAYRSLPKKVDLDKVIRLGGAEARFMIPIFLLPHHEHLLPPTPSYDATQHAAEEVEKADGKPKFVQAEKDLEQKLKDEANVKLSVHARLPAVFSQELLDIGAALVKATKVIEFEKAPNAMDAEIGGVLEFGRALKGGMKEGFKKTVVDTVANDKWVAKVVGKIMGKLENAKGDIGYSGEIPIPLQVYRNEGWKQDEGEKILP